MSPIVSWLALGATTVIVGCLSTSSSTDPTQSDLPSEHSVAISDVLSTVGPAVVLPALDDFLIEVELLQQALIDWEDALFTSDESDARVAAQQQWTSSMLSWHLLEVMQIGPSAPSTEPGGDNIRDDIYSWPSVNPCRIDQETAEEAWSEDDFFQYNLVNSYGMDALEHILWADPDNACTSQQDINASGTWDRLGEDGVAENRAAFSLALVEQIHDQAAYLREVWSQDGGDFSSQLAMSSGSVYSGEQEALNAVFDALFYIEIDVKDRKLAYPLGLRDCISDCPSNVEHVISGIGIAAIEANLIGFQQLFSGGDGYGFDDLLVQIGHGDLSAQMVEDIDAAIVQAATLDMPLDEALVSNIDDLMALHNAIKAVTDALKGDLATVLVLEIPKEVKVDTD
jgi:predicted lipoprotein